MTHSVDNSTTTILKVITLIEFKRLKNLTAPGDQFSCPLGTLNTVLDRVPKEDAANFESAAFL